MTMIVEKPKTPISRRANIGLYYIKNWKLLFEGIDHVLASPTNQGEYYLTDAIKLIYETTRKVETEVFADAEFVKGVNDRWQLAEASAALPSPPRPPWAAT